MKTNPFIISLIINIFLAILLLVTFFFKSAINDILKEWWLERRKKINKKTEKLIELRSNLSKIERVSSILLVSLAVEKNPNMKISKEETKKQIINKTKELGQINDLILKNEPYFPESIRKLYKKYKEKYGQFIEKIFISGERIYREDLLEMLKEEEEIINSIIKEIEINLKIKLT